MSENCKSHGNHTIGAGNDGSVMLDDYIENDRAHPGEFYRYCPNCGIRIQFLDDLADKYEKREQAL